MGKIFAAVVVLFFSSCISRTNVTDDSNYEGSVKLQYETQVDMFVYRIDWNRELRIQKIGDYPMPTLGQLKRKDGGFKFPQWHYASKIFGILPAKSTFILTKIVKESSVEMDVLVYYGQIFSSRETQFIGKTVVLNGITRYEAHDGSIPFFDNAVATLKD